MLQLKMLRTNLGRKQSAVADALGISRQAYSNYESGKRTPDIDTIKRMAQYFNVSIDALVGKFDLQLFSNTPQAKATRLVGRIMSSKDDKKIELIIDSINKISTMSPEQIESLNMFLSTIK